MSFPNELEAETRCRDALQVEKPYPDALQAEALRSRLSSAKRGIAMAGFYFEEFEVGRIFQHAIRRTVTEADNVLFSAMTHNPAPLHIDHEYMRTQSEFGQPLINSFFTLGLIVGISIHETTLGTTVANLGMEEVRFPHPLFAGDTVHVETEVLAVRPSRTRPLNGILTLEHRGYNQQDELVAVCKRAVLMLRRPA